MVGNSLTSFNDLAGMVADLAVRGGEPRPTVISQTQNNWSLEDHLGNPASTAAIDDPDLDVIVMQQGPSTLPASGANLLEFSTIIADRVAKNGTRVGMYVVWPPIGGDINAGIDNYTAAANARNMAIYPVAHGFRHVRANFPAVLVYGPDDFHPSTAGTWLAAMIITAVIYDHDPLEYPNILPRQIPAEWEATLRATAKLMVDTYGRR